jgi:hypothetical protein
MPPADSPREKKKQSPSKPVPASRNRSRPPASKELSHVRWIVLILAIGLVFFSLLLRLEPSLIPKGSSLASDAFGKVGIVLFCMWLAWPAVEMVWRSPSGTALAVAFALSVGLFLYQRKTIYFTGPFLIVATVLALLLGRIRRA